MTDDLIDLVEWNRFAEQGMTLLEALTILNNRHREEVAKLKKALFDCREDSIDLLGERSWWKDEPRGRHQLCYKQISNNIEQANKLLEDYKEENTP